MNKNDVGLLIEWFEKNKRQLPWRENRNPYEIWISEIMLQQTRVEAVIGYYKRFLKELPGVAELANCPEDKLLKLWEGLGYYTRARNLKKGAQKVVEQFGGELPQKKEELLKIDGIGSYTASAIASQAFEEPVAAVDGNVLRVYTRYHEDVRDISKAKTKTEIETELAPVMPAGKCGDFNQAMMELGATVCVPNGAPKCGICPLAGSCKAYKNGSWEELPKKTVQKARRIEDRTVFLVFYENQVLIRKRENRGLLAGLYEFPNVEGHMNKKDAVEAVKKMGLHPLQIKKSVEAKHIFSHVEWHMSGFEVKVDETERVPKDCLFIRVDELEKRYSVPSAFRAYREIVMGK